MNTRAVEFAPGLPWHDQGVVVEVPYLEAASAGASNCAVASIGDEDTLSSELGVEVEVVEGEVSVVNPFVLDVKVAARVSSAVKVAYEKVAAVEAATAKQPAASDRVVFEVDAVSSPSELFITVVEEVGLPWSALQIVPSPRSSSQIVPLPCRASPSASSAEGVDVVAVYVSLVPACRGPPAVATTPSAAVIYAGRVNLLLIATRNYGTSPRALYHPERRSPAGRLFQSWPADAYLPLVILAEVVPLVSTPCSGSMRADASVFVPLFSGAAVKYQNAGKRSCPRPAVRVQCSVASVNALSLVDKLQLFMAQVERAGLFVVGLQEARLSEDRAWRSKELLLISSALDESTLNGCLLVVNLAVELDVGNIVSNDGIADQGLRVGQRYFFLGISTVITGSIDMEIAFRIKAAAAALAKIRPLLRLGLGFKSNLQCIKIYFCSRLFYAAGCWPVLSQRNLNKLRTAYCKAVRDALGQSWDSRKPVLSDIQLRATFGFNDVADTVDARLLKFFCRVAEDASEAFRNVLSASVFVVGSFASALVDAFEFVRAFNKLASMPSFAADPHKWADLATLHAGDFKEIASMCAFNKLASLSFDGRCCRAEFLAGEPLEFSAVFIRQLDVKDAFLARQNRRAGLPERQAVFTGLTAYRCVGLYRKGEAVGLQNCEGEAVGASEPRGRSIAFCLVGRFLQVVSCIFVLLGRLV